MAVPLTPPELQRLVGILQRQPEFREASGRQSLLTAAFGFTDKADVISGRANLGGSPITAAVDVISLLVRFGQVKPGVESLGMFLDHLLMNMGDGEDARFMSDLITRYHLNAPPLVLPLDQLPKPEIAPHAAGKYVFISHARPERALAEQIETYLESAGFNAFRDVHDVQSGENWDMAIEKALNEATHMVLLLSASSMPYRKEVYREWFYYDQKQKPIIPLFVQECTLHSRLIVYQWIDAREDFCGALAKLVEQLK